MQGRDKDSGWIHKATTSLVRLRIVSFIISERLARQLRLPWQRHAIQVDGISGVVNKSSRSIVQFDVHPLKSKNESLAVEAVVLPKVASNLPIHHIPFDRRWERLKNGLRLVC